MNRIGSRDACHTSAITYRLRVSEHFYFFLAIISRAKEAHFSAAPIQIMGQGLGLEKRNEVVPGGHKGLIALVSNSAWAAFNFRLDLIRYLSKKGYRVMVIAPSDEFAPVLEQEGCTYVPIQFNNRSENPLQDLGLYWQLRRIYREHRPDFIFHYVIKPNIYGSLAAAAVGIRSIPVITGLGYAFARKNWLHFIVQQLYKRALRKTEEVWFLNNEDARIFCANRIVPIEKTKVLPGEGINTDYFSPGGRRPKPAEDPFNFLMSSRLLKSKGIGLYADAVRILKKKNHSLKAVLIGFFEKNHPDSIHSEQIQKWEQEGLIQYGGFARDVRSFLQQADCFVFPSFYNEGIPRCLMEAASMELPIVTSFNRGCKEVVLNNSNGFVCNQHDPFDLADKMEKMMSLTAEERCKMGRNGRALVIRKFNISKVIEEYQGTLDRMQL